jgi:hypothetical protein
MLGGGLKLPYPDQSGKPCSIVGSTSKIPNIYGQ